MADNTKNDDKHDKHEHKAGKAKSAKGKHDGRALKDRMPEGRDALAIGAAVVGGVALVAALFAGKRRTVRDDTGGHAEGLDSTKMADANTGGFSPALAGTASGTGIDSDDNAKLHAMGTPSTVPVDDEATYTGGGTPDLAISYVPGSDQDTGSAPAGATR